LLLSNNNNNSPKSATPYLPVKAFRVYWKGKIKMNEELKVENIEEPEEENKIELLRYLEQLIDKKLPVAQQLLYLNSEMEKTKTKLKRLDAEYWDKKNA
jgi:hypothetical protein